MEAFITTGILGVILIALGVMNMKGNISSLHWYHRQRVTEEDRKPFGKLVGLGTLMIGVAMILFGILFWIYEITTQVEHPITHTEHTLTVTEYEKQELTSKAFAHEEYEFPTHHTAMSYTVEPELPNKNFQVRDCLDNDEPKRRPKKPYDPQASYDACSIAIIGGADGPTTMIISNGSSNKAAPHAALSALHFEPVDDVEWKIVFREKPTDDIEVDIIP